MEKPNETRLNLVASTSLAHCLGQAQQPAFNSPPRQRRQTLSATRPPTAAWPSKPQRRCVRKRGWNLATTHHPQSFAPSQTSDFFASSIDSTTGQPPPPSHNHRSCTLFRGVPLRDLPSSPPPQSLPSLKHCSTTTLRFVLPRSVASGLAHCSHAQLSLPTSGTVMLLLTWTRNPAPVALPMSTGQLSLLAYLDTGRAIPPHRAMAPPSFLLERRSRLVPV